MADCCKGKGCWFCMPYHFQQPESLWGDYCMLCNNDHASPGNCKFCVRTYEKLKARGELPRRREAVAATRRNQ